MKYAPILAHFGHWYISLPTFMVPTLIIMIALKASAWRDRRRILAGDTSHLRVQVTSHEDHETLTVTGPLDNPTLIDIEHELGVVARRASNVLLDLSHVTSATDELAWRIPEIISDLDDDGAVTVTIGSAPALQSLKKICAIEGVKLTDDATQPSDPAGP